MKDFDYEKALLDYEEAVLRQRIKYADTPPGLPDPAARLHIAEMLAKKRVRLERQASTFLRFSSLILPEPFAGRKKELDLIASSFMENRSPVVICGIGGIGKTALARTYAARMRGYYEQILFLTCGSSLRRLFANDTLLPVSGLEYHTDIYGTRNRYLNVKLKALAAAVSSGRTLLVIDDLNHDEGKIQDRILQLSCDVLVTSRMAPSVWHYGTAFELKAMDDEREWDEFYALFDGIAQSSEEQRPQLMRDLDSYRSKVQGHTLRMKLYAASQARPSGDMPDLELLDRFSLKKDEILALMMLSAMPSEGIGLQRFLAISGTDKKTIASLMKYLLIQTPSQKAVHSFAECGDSSYADPVILIHPLIRESVRKKYSPTAVKCRKLLQGLSGRLKLIWHENRLESDKWEPVVTSVLEAFGDPVPWLAREYETVCTWLWLQEYYEDALKLMKKILKAVEDHYGHTHTMTGEMQLRLAAVYFNSRNMEMADIWYERAYSTLKKGKSQDYRHKGQLSLAAAKLSRVYRSRRDYDRAMELIDEAISLFYECIDPLQQTDASAVSLPFRTYLTVSYYYLDRGKIFLRTSRIPEAEDMYRMAREALKKDPAALNLADHSFGSTEYQKYRLNLLIAKGDQENAEAQARAMLDYALTWRTETHSYTLDVREWLGDVLSASGKKEEGRKEYALVLAGLITHHPMMKNRIGRIRDKLQRSL